MNTTRNEREWDEHADDIPPDVRREVLRRDNYRCRRCGNENTDALTLHHVIYRSQGGTHHPDNLVTLCWMPCHRLVHDGKLKVLQIKGKWFFKHK